MSLFLIGSKTISYNFLKSGIKVFTIVLFYFESPVSYVLIKIS
jgi:hypothetical protein